MIDIEFRLNGRKIGPRDIANELERAMLSHIREEITRKLKGIRDPETGEVPKIVAKGRGLNDLSFEVSGPESLVTEVKRRLS